MKKMLIFFLVILAIVLGLLWYVKKDAPASAKASAGKQGERENGAVTRVTFLDIGQGDASFIEFPDGQQMLVDCAIDARILPALGRVMRFNDNRIDYVLATHPDKDHYGGCIDVLKRFDVGTVVYNGLKKPEEGYWRAFKSAIQEEHAAYVELDSETTWDIASATLRFLYPDAPVNNYPHGLKDDNNSSIVFSLIFASSSVLFTGDAEDKLEAYLLSKYGDKLDADVLKVGHHGSDSSSIKEFIEAVSPLHAVFSVGADNTYGHPSRRVMKRLERASSTVWRTDTQGDITVRLGSDGIKVEARGK